MRRGEEDRFIQRMLKRISRGQPVNPLRCPFSFRFRLEAEIGGWITRPPTETACQSGASPEEMDDPECHPLTRVVQEEGLDNDEDAIRAVGDYGSGCPVNDGKLKHIDDDYDGDNKNDRDQHEGTQGLPAEGPMEEDVEDLPDQLGGEANEESPLLNLPTEIWSRIWKDLHWDMDPQYTTAANLYGDMRELIGNIRTWGRIFAALTGNDSSMAQALVAHLNARRWLDWGIPELGTRNGINLQALGGRFPLVLALFKLKGDYDVYLKDHRALEVLAQAIVLKRQGVEAGHGSAHMLTHCVRDDANACGYNSNTLSWYVADYWAANWPENWRTGTILGRHWTSRPITEEDDVWEYEIVGVADDGLPQLAFPGTTAYVRGL